MVCESIADQSVGSSSGPFNTPTPHNDADAAGVVVVMLSNLSFGSGSLSVFLHRLT